jgi:hypothetical protein
VIALSQRDPSLFHRLVLVCPTGIEELEKPITLASTLVRALLRTPVLGTSVYNAIASRASIRKYLATRIYADPTRVTDEVVDAYYTSAHQPGGDNALPSFVSGYLNANVAEAFKGVVDLPLIVWGSEAKQTPVSQAEAFLQANPNAKLEVIEGAGMLPHDENPEAFLTAVRPFLAGAPEGDEEEEEDEDGGGARGKRRRGRVVRQAQTEKRPGSGPDRPGAGRAAAARRSPRRRRDALARPLGHPRRAGRSGREPAGRPPRNPFTRRADDRRAVPGIRPDAPARAGVPLARPRGPARQHHEPPDPGDPEDTRAARWRRHRFRDPEGDVRPGAGAHRPVPRRP